jgi:Spy/CpxP family protein refolding chaperone
MKRLVSILILVLAVASAVTAQNGRTKFATDMYQAKHEMIIEELGLTPTQQKQFMPLYEQMEREIYQVNRNARALASEVEKKKNPTDKDYEAAASALSNTRVQEGDIEAKYFEKFSKILSKKQLFQLKQAEMKFTREMLSKKRNKKK